MEEGVPTSNRPAEIWNFVTSVPGNILVQGDFFSLRPSEELSNPHLKAIQHGKLL